MFTHLHLHTEYSAMDGATRIKDLVSRVKEMGMSAVAITDHGNMFGAFEFYKECKKGGIKPIIGCEVYVCDNMDIKEKPIVAPGEKPKKDRHHLILLAKNQIGYQNLSQIVSEGYTRGFYTKPRVDFELIKKHHEGIICLTACIGGEIPRAILSGNMSEAMSLAKKYKDLFGDDFYFEVQNHGMSEEETVFDAFKLMSQKLNIKIVATNDSHYLNKEDAQLHDMMLAIQSGKTVDDPTRMKFPVSNLHVTSEAEMQELFDQQYLDVTQEIVDKINFEMEVVDAKNAYIKEFDCPDGLTPKEYLRKISYEGLKKRYSVLSTAIKKRIEFELDTISRMNFDSYFLIVWDFIKFAKDNGIPVGPGRGSGAGSLVAYATGITDIDPLGLNLYFERFLNPDRISMPDFDIDFCQSRREEVIEYVFKKYGPELTCQVIAYGRYQAKGAIRAVGRAYDVPLATVDSLTKLFPKIQTKIDNVIEENPDIKKIYEDKEDVRSMLLEKAKFIEGKFANMSTHAAGVVIASKNIPEIAPVATYKGKVVTQFDKTQIEDVGLIKFDFLGLKTLTFISNALKSIKRDLGKGIVTELHDVGDYLNNPDPYVLLQRGKTLGVFQMESPGMTKLAMRVYSDAEKRIKKVNAIKDEKERKFARHELASEFFERFIALVSIYRPGPMEYADDYVYGMNHPDDIHYDHPLMEKILSKTYGQIIYQEQAMEATKLLAGYTMAEADNFRKIMGKKQVEKMPAEHDKFMKGCEKNNVPREAAEIVWEKMKKFCEYAFNKSHAACYALIGYQTMVLKYYHLEHFFAEFLTIESGDLQKLSGYLSEVSKGYSIKVNIPSVNKSNVGFAVDNKTREIIFGLSSIKGLGEEITSKIVEERERGGEFKNIHDFVKRCYPHGVGRSKLLILNKAGAFLEFGNKKTISENLESIVKDSGVEKKKTSIGVQPEMDLLEMFGQDVDLGSKELVFFESDPKEDLKNEKEALGIYVSDHPLNKFENVMSEVRIPALSKVIRLSKEEKLKDGDKVLLAGTLEDFEIRYSKKGNRFATFLIDDRAANAEAIAFEKTLDKIYGSLEKGESYIFAAKLNIETVESDQEGFVSTEIKVKLLIDNAVKLEENLEMDYLLALLRKEKMITNR